MTSSVVALSFILLDLNDRGRDYRTTPIPSDGGSALPAACSEHHRIVLISDRITALNKWERVCRSWVIFNDSMTLRRGMREIRYRWAFYLLIEWVILIECQHFVLHSVAELSIICQITESASRPRLVQKCSLLLSRCLCECFLRHCLFVCLLCVCNR